MNRYKIDKMTAKLKMLALGHQSFLSSVKCLLKWAAGAERGGETCLSPIMTLVSYVYFYLPSQASGSHFKVHRMKV